MIPFSGMVTYDGTISFTHTDGRVYTILKSHSNYTAALEKLREVQKDDTNTVLRDELHELATPARALVKSSNGHVTYDDATRRVLFDDQPINNAVADRIVSAVQQGFDVTAMANFLENVKQNPSFRAINELYRFMEANQMGVTSDGYILAYKRVTNDFKDCRTRTLDNSVGARVSMPRSDVNDDPTQTCSSGLHVCSMGYLPHYYGEKVIVCKIHPKDVVSVPIDYSNAKMRVCEYEVLAEIDDPVRNNDSDPLARRAVWSDDDCFDEEVEWNDGNDAEPDEFGLGDELNEDDAEEETTVLVTFEELAPLIVDHIPLPPHIPHLTPTMTFEEIGADDLDVIEVIMVLEDKFKVKIFDDDLKVTSSMQDAVQVVNDAA